MTAAAHAGWPRRPEVQGLRAIAVVAVVAFHAGLPVPGGFLGVDAFFVVSGWALTGLLLAELEATGHIRVGTFLARRARRLLPLLALVVACTAVAHVLTSNPYVAEPVVPRTALAGLSFVANGYLYRNTGYFGDASDGANPLLHLWSLSTEEQLYLGLPVVLLVGWRARRRRSGPAAALAAVGAASAALAWALGRGWGSPWLEAPGRFAFYAPVTRAWEMALGGLVAVAASAPWAPRPRVAAAGAVAGAAGLLGSFALVGADGAVPLPAAAPAALATALLLLTLTRCPAPHGHGAAGAGTLVAALLASAPARWIGDRSYGWYLWHWPAIVVAGRMAPGARPVAVLAGAGALGLAALTHGPVEERFRHDPTLLGARGLALAVACLAVPASLAVVAESGARHGWGLEQPADWSDIAVRSRDGCVVVNRDLPDAYDPSRCAEVPRGAAPVVLLGDAAVANVEPGVSDAARALGLGSVVWGRAGCPFTGSPAVAYDRCAGWLDAAWELVDRSEPAAVVVANASLEHVSGPAVPGDPVQGHGVEGRGSRLERWRAALDGLLDRLAERRIAAVVVGPVPSFGADFPRSRLWPLRPRPGVPARTRRDVTSERAATVAAERAVVADHPAAAYVDPLEALCEATCRPVRDGRWTYAGPELLTIGGGRLLAPHLEAALVAVGAGR